LLIILGLVNSLFVIVNSDGRTPPLGDLAVFVAVAEAEGFSAAARHLGLSKAMISVAVARLEKRLGVRLFQRTTRRLSLTEAGAATLPHAQRSLLAARDAEEAASQTRTSPRGLLRVNAPMSFGLLHVVPALGAFARAFPEVQVDLVLDDRVLDLVEGRFDLAVRIGALPDSGLIAQQLGRSRNVLLAHRDYLARAGTPARPSDLAKHAALLYSLSSTGQRWLFRRGKQRESVRVSGPLKANSSLALRQALLQGLGIARLPTFIAGEDLAAGRLVRVLPDWDLPDQGIHALTTARDHVPRKTRAFIDFFRGRLGPEPYWERGHSAPV
jgi:DNA-binding transcriptional LysR family regulator